PVVGDAAPGQPGALRARVPRRLPHVSARRTSRPVRYPHAGGAAVLPARHGAALVPHPVRGDAAQHAAGNVRAHQHHRGRHPVDLDGGFPSHGERLRRGALEARAALRLAARSHHARLRARALARHVERAALHRPGQGDARHHRGRADRRRVRRQREAARLPGLRPRRGGGRGRRALPRAQPHARAGADLRVDGRGIRGGDDGRPRQPGRPAGGGHRHRRKRGDHHGGHQPHLGAAGVVLAADRDPAVAAGENRMKIALALVAAALVALPYLGVPAFYESFGYLLLSAIVLATSWNVLSGYSGYFSFGHGAFFGVGVYTTAALTGKLGWNFLWTLPLAALAAMVLGVALGAVVFRVRALRGELFALLTLAITFVLATIALNAVDGGPGIMVNADIPKLAPTASGVLYQLMLAAAALTLWTAYAMFHSRFGTGLFAIHDDEDVAEVMGVPTYRFKLAA